MMEMFGALVGIFIFLGLLIFLLNIFTSIWAYRDCQRKGKSKEYALVVLVGTLFFPLIGLIVYLIIRND